MRRWELGQELRRIREEADIKPAVVAKALDISASTLSRIETGRQMIKTLYVRHICAMCSVPEDELVALAEEANQPEWYHAHVSKVPSWFRQYLGYEAAATEIRTYCVELVDGLMQTEDYASAIGRASQPDESDRDLDSYVALRRGRQARLTGEDPPRLHVVMHQAALASAAGGPAVMRGQCERLLELADLDHVTLRVLPFGVGAHPAMTSPFTMLGFDVAAMATVYLENGRGAVYLDGKPDLDRYGWIFDQLTGLSLTAEKTLELIARVASDL